MKKLVLIALFVFWTLITAIVIAGLVFYQNKNTPGGAEMEDTKGIPGANAELSALTAAEVSKHSSSSSCWMTMGQKVYNITNYLPYHPGGVGEILPYCGKDGGAAFAGLPHSKNASNILASYYIGNVGSSVSLPSSTPSGNASPSSAPYTPPRRHDDDDD